MLQLKSADHWLHNRSAYGSPHVEQWHNFDQGGVRDPTKEEFVIHIILSKKPPLFVHFNVQCIRLVKCLLQTLRML